MINMLLAVFIAALLYGFWGKRDVDFLSRSRTDAIKGLGAVMIVFAHMFQFNPLYGLNVFGGGIAGRLIGCWGSIGVALFFALSGYGCAISIKKVNGFRETLQWLCHRFFKLIVFYVISFCVVLILQTVVYGAGLSIRDVLISFVKLEIPGTTTWYLKIQLLLYIFLALSLTIKKERRLLFLTVITFGYALLAWKMGAPDYWWMTSMCFPAGYGIEYMKETLMKKTGAGFVSLFLFMSAISYVGMLYIGSGFFVLKLAIYVVMSVGAILFLQTVYYGNNILSKLGKYSLSLYLVHIGIVEKGMLIEKSEPIKTCLFIIIAVLGTAVTQNIASFLVKKYPKYK